MFTKVISFKLAAFILLGGASVFAQELSSAKLRDLDFPPSILEKPVRPESVDPDLWSGALESEINRNWVQAAERWSEIADVAESSQLFLRSAACYLREEQFSEAFRELNRAVAISPARSPVEEHLRALAHWEAGDYRQAWKTLVTLIRSGNEDGMHHYHLLTRVALSQNDRAEAIGWARKVAEGGTQKEREEFFSNPAFTILERSRLYELMKKDALDPSRNENQNNDWMEGDEAFEYWNLNLTLTNHNHTVSNNTMMLDVRWLPN